MSFEWITQGHYWRGRFEAMASPCEILIDSEDEQLARRLYRKVRAEARRIEAKYSRYRTDSELSRINRSRGKALTVDEETARLLDYADLCHQLSEGKFDISSGVLRQVWRFDGSDRLPDADAVAAILQRVGWEKVLWRSPEITLPPDMELDFGGIGKEYAVDRCARLCREESDTPVLLNFGGDLHATAPRRDGRPWRVNIDDPRVDHEQGVITLELGRGAIATSGDACRYLLKEGVRYSHILDPQTGWPVRHAPRSVTVTAATCIEAGMLATFAMLQGERAEQFLEAQQVAHWVIR